MAHRHYRPWIAGGASIPSLPSSPWLPMAHEQGASRTRSFLHRLRTCSRTWACSSTHLGIRAPSRGTANSASGMWSDAHAARRVRDACSLHGASATSDPHAAPAVPERALGVIGMMCLDRHRRTCKRKMRVHTPEGKAQGVMMARAPSSARKPAACERRCISLQLCAINITTPVQKQRVDGDNRACQRCHR